MTKENVDNLGFLEWDKCKDLLEKGLVKGSTLDTRRLIVIAQLVTIGKRFGVKKAEPDYAVLEKLGEENTMVQNGYTH